MAGSADTATVFRLAEANRLLAADVFASLTPHPMADAQPVRGMDGS